MANPVTAAYIPLATERTKQVVKNLRPGGREKIDLINVLNPDDRLEADAWLVEDGQGVHFRFNDGAGGHEIEFGFADQVRETIAEAPLEE